MSLPYILRLTFGSNLDCRLPTLSSGLARVSFLDRPGSTASVPRRYSAHPVLYQDNNNPRSHHTLGHSAHPKHHSGHSVTSSNSSLNKQQLHRYTPGE